MLKKTILAVALLLFTSAAPWARAQVGAAEATSEVADTTSEPQAASEPLAPEPELAPTPEPAPDPAAEPDPLAEPEPPAEPAPTPPPVQAVELKVGPAHVSGFVSFLLSTSANGDAVSIEAVVDQAPLTASQKAEVVAAAVAAEPSGSWRAAGQGGTLTFQHVVGDTWESVDVVASFTDTTGAGTKLTSSDTSVAFSLSLDEAAVAVGYDAMGEPSFITVSVTDTLTWTQALQGGETAQTLLDTFERFLAAEAGEGVEVVRTSASSLTVVLHYEESHLNWQVTDLGLESSVKGEGVRLDDPAMLIRRGR